MFKNNLVRGILVFFLINYCNFYYSFSQNHDVLFSAGGIGWDEGRSIAVDKDGSIYLTGSFQNEIDFASIKLKSDGADDIFLVKFDSNGIVQWAKRAGGAEFDKAYGVAVVGNDIYIAGYFEKTANFNTPSQKGKNEIESLGNYDIFVAKYNESGSFLWAKSAGGKGRDEATGIAVLESYIYITGFFEDSVDFNSQAADTKNIIVSAGDRDIFLAKFNNDGVIQWVKQSGSFGDDYASGIATNGTSVYITGCFENTINFSSSNASDKNIIQSSGGKDVFLAKFSNSGIFEWAKRAGGIKYDLATGVAVSGSDIFITGCFTGTANFNTPSENDLNEIVSFGQSDIFLAKYDETGNIQWARRAGSDNEFVYSITAQGSNVFIVGEFQSSANFNTPSDESNNLIVSGGDNDIFIAKFNNDGEFNWAKRAGGVDVDRAYGIAIANNTVYITGIFRSSANFNNPSESDINDIISKGNFDIFIAKYDDNSLVTDFLQYDENFLSVYPNPVFNILCIKLSNYPSTYILTDISGQTIERGQVTTFQNTINLKNKSAGIYFLCINNQIIKLVKK